MNRDWDVIREILCRTENLETDAVLTLGEFQIDKHAIYSYNAGLVIEAGLVRGEVDPEITGGIPDFSIYQLTWEGHDFFDSIRSQKVWDKIKDKLSSEGISVTLGTLKATAVQTAKDFLL